MPFSWFVLLWSNDKIGFTWQNAGCVNETKECLVNLIKSALGQQITKTQGCFKKKCCDKVVKLCNYCGVTASEVAVNQLKSILMYKTQRWSVTEIKGTIWP